MPKRSVSRVKRVTASFGVVLLTTALVLGCSDDDGDTNATGAIGQTGTTPAANASPTGSSPTTGTAGTTGTTAETTEIEQAVRDAVDAYNAGDAEGFFGSMTDEGVASFLSLFGLPTDDLEAAKQEAAPFIGEDPLTIQELTVTDSSEDSATVETIAETTSILEGDRFELVRENDEWLITGLELFVVSPEIESDYTTVDVQLVEFGFVISGNATFDAGNIAFALENAGQQPHEAFLVRVEEGVDLQEALQAEGEPEGIEPIGGVFNVNPGDSYNMVLTNELEAGRYALVCFLPDLNEGPEGTPHAFKGMVREITIE